MKRLVILARHFPPHVSGGARRPYLLARALAARGVDVAVAAPAAPDDVSSVVVPHPHPDPSGGAPARRTLRDEAREWLLWPDPDIRWSRRAAAAAIAELAPPDWVLTTSPPESVHWAGRALARRWRCGWIADFRDEWLARPFRRERRKPLRRAVETVLAKRLLAAPDVLLAVDAVVADEIAVLSGRADVRVIAQFADAPPAPAQLEGPGPHLVYTGGFSMSDPNCPIEPVLDAFAAASARRPELRLHLAGRLTDAEARAVEASPAAGAVVRHGVVSYAQARALQAAADAFIVTAAPDATAIPGKVFEYRAVGAPIIAVGEGPWRAIGGYDAPGADRDPVARMTSTERRDPAAPGAAARTPDDAAAELLDAVAASRRGRV